MNVNEQITIKCQAQLQMLELKIAEYKLLKQAKNKSISNEHCDMVIESSQRNMEIWNEILRLNEIHGYESK